MKYLLALFLLVSFNFQVRAQEEDREAMVRMSEDFGKCSAVFLIMASNSEVSGKEFSAKQDRQLANGAKVASIYLARVAGRSHAQERADSIIDTETTMFMALLENNAEKFLTEYKAKYDFCVSRLELQETVINMARKEVYEK